MQTQTTRVIDHDVCGLILFVVFALYTGPMLIRYGRRLLRGRYPQKGTWEFHRTVSLVNMYNSVCGGPVQDFPLEWQWRAFGYGYVIFGMALTLSIPYCLVLLVGYG